MMPLSTADARTIAEDILFLASPAILPATRTLQVAGKLPCSVSVRRLYIHDSTELVGRGFLFIDVPLYTTLLWTSDQPAAEASTYTTRNISNIRTSIASVRLEPATPTNDQPQTHAIDRTASVKFIAN
jgi:hypothetical protein